MIWTAYVRSICTGAMSRIVVAASIATAALVDRAARPSLLGGDACAAATLARMSDIVSVVAGLPLPSRARALSTCTTAGLLPVGQPRSHGTAAAPQSLGERITCWLETGAHAREVVALQLPGVIRLQSSRGDAMHEF